MVGACPSPGDIMAFFLSLKVCMLLESPRHSFELGASIEYWKGGLNEHMRKLVVPMIR